MSGNEAKADELLPSHMGLAVKTYSVFNSGRLEFFYTAITDAKDGEICMVTQYVYDGATTRVLKTKESKATWQLAWDV